ncbi:MAG: hypothetical protein HQL17_05305 [Candidatus Omnitrophica bacterium]|nr:hypothetical protein [Candidatus Omnitrophota bacterium]
MLYRSMFAFFLLLTVTPLCSADTLTLTTYYPSPSGDYQDLSVAGVITFPASGSTMSRAPRTVHSTDPRGGCPGALAANTDFWTMAFTLTRAGTVLISGDSIRNALGRADLILYVDGTMMMQTITNTGTTSDWVGGHVQWTGTLAAGAHNASMRSPQANIWGCGSSWSSMDAVIFEN